MKNFPLIVSYYTKDTLYQLEVQNLIATCERFGLAFYVQPIESFGSWERNCAYKPLFLLERLKELRRPIFWVDADAIFLKEPRVLDVFDADIAVRMNRFGQEHPSCVMSGSIYVNATSPAVALLKEWAQGCLDSLADPNRTEEMWDQVVLRDVIHKGRHGAKVCSLPEGYTTILGHPVDEAEIEEKVIGHMQASRRFKNMF